MAQVSNPSPLRIAILSANETPWGGSEELWFETALGLSAQGCRVHVLKPRLPHGCDRMSSLKRAGCGTSDLTRPFLMPRILYEQIVRFSRLGALAWLMFWAGLSLLRFRPHLVVLAQGGNWDGVHLGFVLNALKLPYVIISQKAAELYWPPDKLRRQVQMLYRRAKHAYFVSDHNRELTELQLGERLHRASVVRNPFLVDFHTPAPWPVEQQIVNLACVGRLYPMEKGQDLLLQLLAKPKWRERPLRVTFFGEGVNEEALQGIVDLLGLENVHFAGQVDDVTQIWREHHALVLPSRAEGLPLVIVEAMLAGRVVIATNAGGNGEVIDDGICGFVSDSCSVAGLDEAMERAWARLPEWPAIASAAADHIRRLVPQEPGGELAAALMKVADDARVPVSADQSLAQAASVVSD